MHQDECTGQHRYHVAEVVGVEAEGKVVVLIVCINCGDFKSPAVDLGHKGSPIRLLIEEKQKEN